MPKRKIYNWLIGMMILAAALRFFNLGQDDLKEDEYYTLKSASYLYYCRQSQENCQETAPSSFKSKFWALILNNETKPNLVSQAYLWNFVNQEPTQTHHNRAWPYLQAVSLIYQTLGISEWSTRFLSAAAGSLLIFLGFRLGKLLSGSDSLSLIYAAALTFSFHLVEVSRLGRMYAWFILMFNLAILGCLKIIKAKRIKLRTYFLTGIILLLSYWLHLLTLLLPVALLIYGGFKNRRLFFSLLLMLMGLIGLSWWLNADFFHRYFWQWQAKPHWQYLEYAFDFTWLWWLNPLIIIIGLKTIAKDRLLSFLFSLVATYLGFLIFFSNLPPGGAYVICLLPVIFWLIVSSLSQGKRIWLYLWLGLIFIRWFLGSNYLYFGRDGQPKIQKAYQLITSQYRSGEAVSGFQVRDYYLQALPDDMMLTEWENETEMLLPSLGWVIWEKDKIKHLKPELIQQLKLSFTHLAGEGIDKNGVEIYRLGK